MGFRPVRPVKMKACPVCACATPKASATQVDPGCYRVRALCGQCHHAGPTIMVTGPPDAPPERRDGFIQWALTLVVRYWNERPPVVAEKGDG